MAAMTTASRGVTMARLAATWQVAPVPSPDHKRLLRLPSLGDPPASHTTRSSHAKPLYVGTESVGKRPQADPPSPGSSSDSLGPGPRAPSSPSPNGRVGGVLSRSHPVTAAVTRSRLHFLATPLFPGRAAGDTEHLDLFVSRVQHDISLLSHHIILPQSASSFPRLRTLQRWLPGIVASAPHPVMHELTELPQAFENTSTNVAAAQMRNALTNLAETVEDPKQKKVRRP